MSTLFSNTPSVTVLDNRGLTARNIEYYRHPDVPLTTTQNITYHRYDAHGALISSADPRQSASGSVNFNYINDLSGMPMRTASLDGGILLALADAVERPILSITAAETDEAVIHRWQYEDATLPGRQLSLSEQTANGTTRVTERYIWADASPEHQSLNLAGQCISYYDTAGLAQTDSISLSGTALSVTRRLLHNADDVNTLADWQGSDASAWNDLLDTIAYTSLTTSDATGTMLTTTDAFGNQQRVAWDRAGLLKASWVTLKNASQQVIVKSITYSAAGMKLREEHGNGVVTTYSYEPETQFLTGIKTERPVGHAVGAKVLQDLRYSYDPVGNVLVITNDAEETRFWRNQKVVPENRYTYDSLYQLVSTSGREMANAVMQSNDPPPYFPPDAISYTNYSRSYSYDNAGNLLRIRHSAPASNNNYTITLTVSNRSNRAVLDTLANTPSDVDSLFTASGNQRMLQPGQRLSWTFRGELSQVTPVLRAGGPDDIESYRYDADSQRLLKVTLQQAGTIMRKQRALYLPGLELRSTFYDATELDRLQVIKVGDAGRAQVRILHWETGAPGSIPNNTLRYSYDNLTGSSMLELDGNGNIISAEEYYPFGGTAIYSALSQLETEYKFIRYSGKERDASGLYYYGYRYYQPWVGRWLSADPAWTIDGLNLFRMAQNNPVTMMDSNGLYTGAEYGLQPGKQYSKLSARKQAVVDNLMSGVISGKITIPSGVSPGTIYNRDTTIQNIFSKGNVKAKRFPLLWKIATSEVASISTSAQFKKALQQQKAKVQAQAAQQEREVKASAQASADRQQLRDFKTIWSTNAAYPIIKAMSAGKAGSVSGSKVVAELTRRHGEQEFGGATGRELASRLKIAAESLTVASVREIDRALYANKSEGNLRTYYRGTQVSQQLLQSYQSAAKGTIFSSSSLMAVSRSKSVAQEFMNTGNTGLPLLITIQGYSAEPVSAPLVVGAENESLFSTHARFMATQFSRQGGYSQLTLREVRAGKPTLHLM